MDGNPLVDLYDAGRVGQFARPIFPGMTAMGNIDTTKRKAVKNPDGSISTLRSMSANLGNGEVLLPTMSPGGFPLNADAAIDLYRRTGQHLGMFDTPEAASNYAQVLSQEQGDRYGRR